MEYPYLLQIETITGCMSKCQFCGLQIMKRLRGNMSFGMFQKIINDTKEIGILYIVPFIMGEPLLDDTIIEKLQYVKSTIPSAEIHWFTNGQLLTRENIIQLIELDRIKRFNVSIHGSNKNLYESITGMLWDKLINNMKLLVELNNQYGNPFQITGLMVDTELTRNYFDEFKKLGEDLGITTGGCGFVNYGGLLHDEVGEAASKELSYKLCARSQSHIYVTWDGSVISCCFDLNAVNTFGNVNQNSLKEIWESEQYQSFRQKHREWKYTEIPICKDCTANRFNG